MQEKTIGIKSIGEIVSADFRTATVFKKHDIDFCCGGKESLKTICTIKALDLETIIGELEAVQSEPADRSQNYSAWSLSFLTDYIVNTHHAYLKENDEQIAAYARKIAAVHGSHHPEVIKISAIFDKITTDMSAHLKEEEEVFFPAIKRIDAAKINRNAPEKKISIRSVSRLTNSYWSTKQSVTRSMKYAISPKVTLFRTTSVILLWSPIRS